MSKHRLVTAFYLSPLPLFLVAAAFAYIGAFTGHRNDWGKIAALVWVSYVFVVYTPGLIFVGGFRDDGDTATTPSE